jgi:hypothetical protein
MMRAQWRQEIRLELMREAAEDQGCCPRCGKLVESDDEFDQVCSCPYDDWHEEIPEIFPEEDGDAS